jgi:hypothetical protein
MVLAAAILLFQFPTVAVAGNSPQRASEQFVAESPVAAPPGASHAASVSNKATPTTDDGSKSSPQPVQPMTEFASTSMANWYVPPPPAFRPPDEAPVTHRRLWLVLSATEHGSATFDAWSTRNALSNGRSEADPLMRPFAGSPAIYGAIQVIPVGLDYLARRLQRSSGWTRHIWWAPQSAAAATFLFSGSYNVAHTN